jgi:phosphatidyl-myo-inositol dimannoside synthase
MEARTNPHLRILALVPDAFGDTHGRLGGIALYNRDVLTAACEHPGVEAVVALPRLMPGAPETLPPRLEYVTRGLGGRARYLAAVAWEAMRGRFDLILCGHVNLLPAAFLARALTRAPVMALLYGIEVWEPTRSRLTNFLLRWVRTFVSIRELTLERLRAWAGPLPGRDFLLDNAIHLERYGAGPRDEALVERYGLGGRRVLLTVARLEEQYKGIDEMLEVLPELARELPDLVYLVVGSGPDRQRLEEKARSLGVGERVVFAGAVDEGDKPAHFRLADAFVMPGTGADFDRYLLRFVFLEALACGIPTVANRPDGGGEEGSAAARLYVLVEPKDRASIISGVKDALARPRGVPDGLHAFSYETFRRRFHAILEIATCT